MIERTIQYEGYEGQVEIQPLGWRTGYVLSRRSIRFTDASKRRRKETSSATAASRLSACGKTKAEKNFAIGFDCAHYGDTSDRWTTDAVEDELRSMIVQLAEIANEKAR